MPQTTWSLKLRSLEDRFTILDRDDQIERLLEDLKSRQPRWPREGPFELLRGGVAIRFFCRSFGWINWEMCTGTIFGTSYPLLFDMELREMGLIGAGSKAYSRKSLMD